MLPDKKVCFQCKRTTEFFRIRCPHCGSSKFHIELAPDQVPAFEEENRKRQQAAQLIEQSVPLFQAERLVQAEALLRQAIELDPYHATAFGNLGCVYELRGKFAEAIVWFEKAIALDPLIEGIPQRLKHSRTAAKRKAQPDAQLVARLREKGIVFIEAITEAKTVNPLGEVELSRERYRGPSMEAAIEALKTVPVNQHYFYIEVETPEGLVGRDIKAIYQVVDKSGRQKTLVTDRKKWWQFWK